MNDNKKKNNKIEKIDNKGNWEFSFFQKKYDPVLESNIKQSMKLNNSFNPKLVHQYINPNTSKEELLLEKKNNGDILKSKDTIILNNYINKEIELLKNDINNIKLHGLSAKPITKEGKTRLLLHTLDYQIKKNNNELIANIYLRLMEDKFNLSDNIKKDYEEQIEYMEKTIKDLNLIELQFTKLYAQMPPLNVKGFKNFDKWQIEVINNIDNNISTLINAPTSAGKSVLSGYTTTKGRVLFIVPTDALAWQMSTYIGNILDTNIPIITPTYQSCPTRDKLIELLNKAPAITGTAETIIDFLPFIKNDFKWLIFDEIHMIGNPEGSAMEYIMKILYNIPFLALSATIGNTDELINWFSKISNQKVDKIICTKRFFNLQRYYYDSTENKIISIHPLALINNYDFEKLNSIILQPTPPDIWDLATKLNDYFDLEELCPHIYFKDKRIELDDTFTYFDKLLIFINNKFKNEHDKYIIINNILNNYKNEKLISQNTNLIDLAFKLKSEDKNPAIFFQKNTVACLRMVRCFAKEIEQLELSKYPKLYNERLKEEKHLKKIEKKINDNNTVDKEKKALKQMMNTISLKKDSYGVSSIKHNNLDDIYTVSLQEPHPDFILNNYQYFTEYNVKEWEILLKKYFPSIGNEYHFIIKLLWRGVGVYAEGLPDPYLRLVQSLATQKQLGIVFSDKSLIFGISMPFRTVVIIRDNNVSDDLDNMLFQQMCGRAGRRGLDKEGNIIFAGYSWNRIIELSTSQPPIINGNNKLIHTSIHADRLSNLYNTNQNWDNLFKNYLNNSIDEIQINDLINNIKLNYNDKWNFGYISDNINHLHMNWKLRYNMDSILISYLIPYLKKAFENKDHTQEINQINIAHFLCQFFDIQETSDKNNLLLEPTILNEEPYNKILDELKELNIIIPKYIDNKLFNSIQSNKIDSILDENELNKLRCNLILFGEKIKTIQHYFYHSKIFNLSKIMGKLLTRIWWIYHSSSPIMKSLYNFDYEYIYNNE